MTATIVSQQSAVDAVAGTSHTIVPSGIVAGNSIILVIGNAAGLATGSITAVSDTGGNTYTIAVNSGISGVTNTRLAIAYAHNVTAPGTITITSGSIANTKILLLEVSGLQNATHDAVASDFAAVANTATTVPAITLSAPGLAIAAVSHGGTTQDTPSSGWTLNTSGIPDSTAPIVRAAWQEFTVSGSTGTMTMTRDSRQSGAAMIGFKTTVAAGTRELALTGVGT